MLAKQVGCSQNGIDQVASLRPLEVVVFRELLIREVRLYILPVPLECFAVWHKGKHPTPSDTVELVLEYDVWWKGEQLTYTSPAIGTHGRQEYSALLCSKRSRAISYELITTTEFCRTRKYMIPPAIQTLHKLKLRMNIEFLPYLFQPHFAKILWAA